MARKRTDILSVIAGTERRRIAFCGVVVVRCEPG